MESTGKVTIIGVSHWEGSIKDKDSGDTANINSTKVRCLVKLLNDKQYGFEQMHYSLPGNQLSMFQLDKLPASYTMHYTIGGKGKVVPSRFEFLKEVKLVDGI